MTPDHFDRLEAELRAAVPRVHPHAARQRRWRPRSGSLVLAVSAVVTVAVVLASVALVAHRQTPTRTPALRHRFAPGPTGNQYPPGSTPTLAQLRHNFAVLRRPQTQADRSWHPNCSCAGAARQLNRLTRLATTLPAGYRIYLDVEQFILGGQLNLAAGSYVLNFTVVDPHGPTSGSNFGPNTGFTVQPISSGGNDAVWVSVVPDGVANVTWTFDCYRGPRVTAPCSASRARTFTVPVTGNVAARQIPDAGNCSSCPSPTRITWRSSRGDVVASFGPPGYNLAAPPFVKGGRGSRLLRILRSTSLADARLGLQATTAVSTIARTLGPPSVPSVTAKGCGVDHESVWTSPTVAQPLTVFARDGRFVGYRYGAPAIEIALKPGPGAVLATRRGLTLADTVGLATRLYDARFKTSPAHGGTWHTTDGQGILHGAVEPITYPLRHVTAQNPVATIEAGDTGCTSNGR